MEFHISKQARNRYHFDQSLFSFDGNIIFADFNAVHIFTQKINSQRDLLHHPEKAVKASHINAMGLMDEIFHFIISLYARQLNPEVWQNTLQWVESQLGKTVVDLVLADFVTEFPPKEIYADQVAVEDYLFKHADASIHRKMALEECILLWISNRNPALEPYQELFDDSNLTDNTAYLQLIREAISFFDTQPPFGPDQQNLITMLRSPAIHVPDSIMGQLEYIRNHWAGLLGHFLYRLLSSLDFIKEEQKSPFLGSGPMQVPVYGAAHFGAEGIENFSPDRDWMPSLVLIAKNIYVWLDQLRKKYQADIYHLDQIPDEELDQLAAWGFTGIWLIGVWERSQASARIKQLCGNPEAISSAYSLSQYQIATDLGGEEAFQNFRDRAWRRGIRIGSDMVPNHMGIDSPWVLEHPDWFISQDYSPFPSYTFNGPDLSPNPDIGIFIEDHYYDRTDAAVVFKWHNRPNNITRFIYHGNDGTSMPWNDTAQLNYLNPQVREAVIQTILSVARRFPIIRFDAAMTLARLHYQRLWYPEPGTGGDIPSRSQHSMTKAQFESLMNQEFWREVVERAAQEAPDTLLLAEAFWMMEGYFVRTLGMHRVYNSAFMNMLRNEDNEKYRYLIKNTLEFDPEILRRYVNFMNNPDERTAIEQFGDGDKYFGICTLMATMPGLPMFGHGQIEGFTEKYGMEYRRAYLDEKVNKGFVERHKWEIFPLLRQRKLFSGVENFLIYNFSTPDRGINQNVFAFSNRLGNEKALVIYNNKYESTRGWIRESSPKMVKQHDEGGQKLVQKTLGEGLDLHNEPGYYVILRDQANQLEYIRSCQELFHQGFYVELGAFQKHVFNRIEEIRDDQDGRFGRLCDHLHGNGVPSLFETLDELLLQPIHTPFSEIANAGYLKYLLETLVKGCSQADLVHILKESAEKYAPFLTGIEMFTHEKLPKESQLRQQQLLLKSILSPAILPDKETIATKTTPVFPWHTLRAKFENAPQKQIPIIFWSFLSPLSIVPQPDEQKNEQVIHLVDEWKLGKMIRKSIEDLGFSNEESSQIWSNTKLLIKLQNWEDELNDTSASILVNSWFTDPFIQEYLGINSYDGVLWYQGEAFAELEDCLFIVSCIHQQQSLPGKQEDQIPTSAEMFLKKLHQAAEKSHYRVEQLLGEFPLEDE
jgi:glycosidase